MKEYVVLCRNDSSELQKVLNQWRHMYTLEVLNMCVNPSTGTLIVLLTRRDRRKYESVGRKTVDAEL